MARLVSLAAGTLAMPFGNRSDYHIAGAGNMVESSKGTRGRMNGDLQGIAGKSLREIEGLEFSALKDMTRSGEAP